VQVLVPGGRGAAGEAQGQGLVGAQRWGPAGALGASGGGAQRGLARGTRVVARRLKVAVKAAHRAVDRPWRRTSLGFTFTRRRPHRRRVRDKARTAGQEEGRRRPCRTRGESLGRGVGDRRRDREGWDPDGGVATAPASVTERDSWSWRRWRRALGQPGDRRRSRHRRRRGVSWARAWNTGESAPGPWRIRRRPALAIARPGSDFDGLGLPRLHRGAHR
jgi:RNA-directed DNA polymerase